MTPAPGGPTFPVGKALAFADRLDAIAADLDEAARLRVEARDSVPEFQGRHADTYRESVDVYARMISDHNERFRRAAGRLRDAVDDYRTVRQRWVDIGQPI